MLHLIKYHTIIGTIETITGLHIGGSPERLEIGGIDNAIIRNPMNDQPYIPGSSLKGKIRSLLEWHGQNGIPKVMPDGSVHQCDDIECLICRIFGSLGDIQNRGPSRAIFRDAFLTKDSEENLRTNLNIVKGLSYAEIKTENTIDRIKGSALNPRQFERVPPGTKFRFHINYRVFDVDDDNGRVDEEGYEYLKKGIKLLEKDALGRCTSRGYGQVKINIDNEE